MSKEIIFKNAIFGGFKREEVINYIVELQTEIVDSKNVLANKIREIKDCKDEISGLKKSIEAKDKEIEKLKKEISSTKKPAAKKKTSKKEKTEN